VLHWLDPWVRSARAQRYPHQSSSKLNQSNYYRCPGDPQKLDRIGADFEELWSRRCALLQNDPKKLKISNFHFSPLTMNFSIFSSQSMSIRPNIVPELSNFRKFDEKNILKFVAKSENSDFVVKFRPRLHLDCTY